MVIDKEIRDEFQKTREEVNKHLKKEEIYRYYIKEVSKPAYNFTLTYAQLNKHAIFFSNSKTTINQSKWGTAFYQEASRDINKDLRLVELDKDLIPMIVETKNELFYRPLFFPTIFVNCDFEWEGLLIKGFLIQDHNQIHEDPRDSQGISVLNDWTIFSVAIDLEQQAEFYGNYRLLGGKHYVSEYHESEKEKQKCHRLNNFVRQLAVNIIDMVSGNDGDIVVNTVEISREQNLKRIKRGKIQLPTKVYIKPTTPFREVLSRFNEQTQRLGYGHKFMVRGHWRHYRDEKYKEKKGQKKWIKPFYKGQGIAIAKDYKINKGGTYEKF